MSIIKEGIRVESDNSISFGNYKSKDKVKVNDFEYLGDKYILRSSEEMTRLQKNGGLLFESVPGSSIHSFKANEEVITFEAYGFRNTQITLELEPTTKYRIILDDVITDGSTASNSSGKILFSANLDEGKHEIIIEKNL